MRIDTFVIMFSTMFTAVEGEGERAEAANITEEGKMRIKNELQRLYPNYLLVAPISTMLNLYIDTVAKE